MKQILQFDKDDKEIQAKKLNLSFPIEHEIMKFLKKIQIFKIFLKIFTIFKNSHFEFFGNFTHLHFEISFVEKFHIKEKYFLTQNFEKLPFKMIEAVFMPKLTGEIPSRSSLNSVVLFRIKKKLSKI